MNLRKILLFSFPFLLVLNTSATNFFTSNNNIGLSKTFAIASLAVGALGVYGASSATYFERNQIQTDIDSIYTRYNAELNIINKDRATSKDLELQEYYKRYYPKNDFIRLIENQNKCYKEMLERELKNYLVTKVNNSSYISNLGNDITLLENYKKKISWYSYFRLFYTKRLSQEDIQVFKDKIVDLETSLKFIKEFIQEKTLNLQISDILTNLLVEVAKGVKGTSKFF